MATSLPPDDRLQRVHDRLRRSLRTVAERTSADAPAGVDGVGVTVLVGTASVFAGSNAFTDAVDEAQYGLGEGPCLSAVATRRIVTSRRLAAGERRWSRFGEQAAALALRSVTSAPIVVDDEVIGSLNAYSRSPLGLADLPPGRLRGLAAATGARVGGARLLAVAEAGTLHLARALQDRADVERAVGVLMDRYASNANQARTLLAQLARLDGVPPVEAARTVVADAQASASASASPGTG